MSSFAEGKGAAPRERRRRAAGLLTAGAFARRHKSRLAAALACVGPLAVAAAHPSLRGGLASLCFAALCLVAFVWWLPDLTRRAAKLEDAVSLRTAMVLPMRLLRPLLHAPFIAALAFLVAGGQGTSFVLLAMLAVASAQACAIALRLAYRGRGDRIGNTLLAVAVVGNGATLALVAPHPVLYAIVAGLDLWFALDILRAARADLRAVLYPKAGIGVFFGTFNPVHKTHLAIMAAALRERRLTKLYVHPTTVPKLHRTALASGEIAFDVERGMRVYRRTADADPNKDYFPTGNRFFDYAARNALLKAAIRDAALDAWIEVLEVPQVYDRGGFSGVLAHVKGLHPGTPMHGLHGSDPGGMWVRSIFDAAGLYPFPVKRRDRVSATAIRNGEAGMTTPTVTRFLDAMRAGASFTFPSGQTFGPDGTRIDERDVPRDDEGPQRRA